ncbi:CYTH domain-containing protein [Paenibacillus alkalitolerans]|uniref:CYTH domain-containing protein n=1 Tax=Paenibacillus alkalitolerans TaxID=2799335 RepID=UPI0018F3528F|nr:CYTH domain-containing protein [Paenibacillus alkalitolerans]
MKIELNREAKYYCDDFSQIREILSRINARFVTMKQQEDYIFKIYDTLTKTNSKRIKVRIENEESYLVYVYCRRDQETNIEFDYYQVKDGQIISIFTSLYGEAIRINKVREVWSKDNVVFHLDTVEGIGKIFEIELLKSGINQNNEDLDGYKQLFQSYLLKKIEGSNEDLVSGKDFEDGNY